MASVKFAWCAFFVAGILLLAGCPTTRNYGDGECVEYEPVCLFSEEICIIDDKGCRFCSCEQWLPDDDD